MNKTLSRFFIEKNRIGSEEVSIKGDDAHHICAVLRKTPGEHIIICDGECVDYDCALTYIGADECRASIVRRYPNTGEPPVRVSLYQSLPKLEKFEYIIQKCVEAGISDIIPVISEHVQYAGKLDAAKWEKRLARWRSISYAAAKQSGRGIVPKIHNRLEFSEAVTQCADRVGESPEGRLALIPYENETETSLKSKLAAFRINLGAMRKIDAASDLAAAHVPYMGEIHIFIGPEGGYAPAEINLCKQNAILPVTLGPRILKTETAGLAVLCQIMYEFEQ